MKFFLIVALLVAFLVGCSTNKNKQIKSPCACNEAQKTHG